MATRTPKRIARKELARGVGRLRDRSRGDVAPAVPEPKNVFRQAPELGLAIYLAKQGDATATDVSGVNGPDGIANGIVKVEAPDFKNRVEKFFGEVASSNDAPWHASAFVMPAGSGAVTGSLVATDGSPANTGMGRFTARPGAWTAIDASQPGSGGTTRNRLWRIYNLSAPVYVCRMRLVETKI